AEGVWVRAERQTGGRGRQGRAWESPPGNLYASTLVRLRPDDPPAPTLALVAAVALHEAVSLHAAAARIKWPNDITAGGAKLAGILLEREGEAVVVGFGVNLAHHPSSLERPVTSLDALTGEAPKPQALLETLACVFMPWLERWRSEGLAPIRDRWLKAAHPPGTPLMTPEGAGSFDGLDESGALRLLLHDGTHRIVHAGDVFLI
nr:biotin--[acetyl-CoA-carboxylase] ligase [Pseudomonadota bacterium]